MNIAVLGGTFDPPHIGHYLIARQVLEIVGDIDKLLLMPSSQHQWKPTIASASDRVAMLTPFCEGKIELSDIELKRTGVSYTLDTIAQLKKQVDGKIYWLIGSDILSEYDRWENKENLAQLTTFLVFPRDPYHLPETLPEGFMLVGSPDLITTNLSSTIIRDRIKEGKSIRSLVLPETEEYIKQNQLYV